MIPEELLFNYSAEEISITEEEILINMEPESSGLDTEISFEMSGIIEELNNLADFRGQMKLFSDIRFDANGSILKINDLIFNLYSIIFNELSGSDQVALFICTAGKSFSEKSSSNYKRGEFLKGYIYDIAGSIVVEKIAAKMHSELKERANSEHLNLTNLYCPGNCEWDIREQSKLFTLVSGEYAGVELKDSFIMQPVKSISGIIGIGKSINYRENTCDICGRSNCMFRKRLKAL